MAVLSMLLGATVLVFCAVIFMQRLVRGSDPRRRADGCVDGGGFDWMPMTAGSDAGADCSGGDGGGGCDGGGGDGGGGGD